MKRFLIAGLVAMNLLCLDLVTKKLAATYLKGSAAVSVIDGFFNLAYVENRGCAWGMFQGHVWPLAVFGLVALGFIIWKRKSIFGLDGGLRTEDKGEATSTSLNKNRMLRFSAFAEPLLYAGILGNLFDRVVHGHVIDFVDLHWAEAYHFPCFNVADVCITFAAAFLLIASFFTRGSSGDKRRRDMPVA